MSLDSEVSRHRGRASQFRKSLGRGRKTDGPRLLKSRRLPRLALSAALVVISLAGPYPVPFLGYGAAPLLGFGLAFAALARFGARVKQKGFAP